MKRKVSWRWPRPELGCRAKGKKMLEAQEYYVFFIVFPLQSSQPTIYGIVPEIIKEEMCALIRMRAVKYMNKYNVVTKILSY
jgi:hypothetical protein